MNEKEHVIELFRKNFAQKQQKDTIIYGIGKNTKVILAYFTEYPIIGILDGFETSGEVCGVKIWELECIKELECQIIIVANVGSQKIIYNRIREFCDKHNIKVFNLNGEELSNKTVSVKSEHPYFSVNETDLYKEIDNHDNISFDIFNTLITRKVIFQECVFEMVADRIKEIHFDFVKERIKAEKRLADTGVFNIFEIYSEIKRNTGSTQEVIDKLCEMEIMIEKEVIIPRESMVQAFDYAVKLGKKVFLVSDMYLSKEVIESILKEHKIEGYKDILVSCEYQKDKARGLYSKYKKIAGKGTYLHIGDSESADGLHALNSGLDSFLIKGVSDMFDISACQLLLKHMKEKMSIFQIGLYACKVFNNPFELYKSSGRLKIKNYYELGYLYVAPIMIEFVIWMIEKLIDVNYNSILFISRDGYLIKELYDNVRSYLPSHIQEKLPNSKYFHTSRRLGIAASLQKEEDIKYAANLSFDGSNQELLEKRFFLDKQYPITIEDMTREECALLNQDEIFEKGKLLKENYVKYIDKLGIEKNKEIAIFDFVSTGTCQLCIEKILQMKLTGMYFNRVSEDYEPKEKLAIIDFSKECDNYFLLEHLIKEPVASLDYFDQYGNPVYSEDRINKKQKENIKCVHRAIKDYLKDFANITNGQFIEKGGIGEKILKLANEEYVDMQMDNHFEYAIKDEFCNRTIQVSI